MIKEVIIFLGFYEVNCDWIKGYLRHRNRILARVRIPYFPLGGGRAEIGVCVRRLGVLPLRTVKSNRFRALALSL